MKLETKQVEKPWGRAHLPAIFPNPDGRQLGEIWFDAADATKLPLLVKYIFTSERLSIQVHPNDEQARARGYPNGKTECWYILDAEPGATLGIGLTREVDRETLRAAALDGSIEELMDWKPVRAGDFFYVPAGTVHAIGGGISLIEVQQISDVTYRLYDYGRPRELHLDDGIEVSEPRPYPADLGTHIEGGSRVLVAGPHFTLVRVEGAAPEAERLTDRDRMVIPLRGRVSGGGDEAGPGECVFVTAGNAIQSADGAYLVAANGA
ncbi:MAG TPA: class I mannose-6-phosphate isomerase [Allosphingosinicella sp.]